MIFAMRPTDYLKLLGYAMLAMALASCVSTFAANRPKLPEPSVTTQSLHQLDAIRAGGYAANPAIDLKGMSQVLAAQEKSIPADGDGRDLTLTELTRLCFILGELGARQESEKYFQKGRYYAELLCQEKPDRVEGHYWLALNLAGLAQIGRASRGLRMVPSIVEQLQIALSLDEVYDEAGPHRVLGRVYCEAPPWPLSEGDLNKSLEHLQLAIRLAPDNSTNHLYLAATLAQLGKSADAYWELQQVLVCTHHAISPRRLAEDYQEARGLMQQYERSELRPLPSE